MHQLPLEILLSIFEASVGLLKGSKDASHQPRTISHVCRLWRNAALANPRLWTDVQIHGTSPIFRLYLERSRPMPVDLTVSCMGKERGVVAEFAQRELSLPDCQSEMSRLRSLNLLAWSDEELDQLVSPLKDHDLPNLTSLHVEIDVGRNHPPMSPQWWSHRHSHAPILPAHTPSLSAIGLVNKCTGCLGDTSKLTKLELRSFPGAFDCTVVEKIIEDSPLLDTLVLRDLDFLYHHRQESRLPTNMAQIKHLTIESSAFAKGRGMMPRCYCLLRRLVEGDLESLEVLGDHPEALSHLLPSINRRPKDRSPLSLAFHHRHPSMLGLVQRLSNNPLVRVSEARHSMERSIRGDSERKMEGVLDIHCGKVAGGKDISDVRILA